MTSTSVCSLGNFVAKRQDVQGRLLVFHPETVCTVHGGTLRRTDICPVFCGGQQRARYFMKCLRPSARRAIRPQILYRQHHRHKRLTSDIFASTFFCRPVSCGVYDDVNGAASPPDHISTIVICSTGHTRGRSAWRLEFIRFHVVRTETCGTLPVSCAQMSSEVRHYCVSGGTNCSADVCCAVVLSGWRRSGESTGLCFDTCGIRCQTV